MSNLEQQIIYYWYYVGTYYLPISSNMKKDWKKYFDVFLRDL